MKAEMGKIIYKIKWMEWPDSFRRTSILKPRIRYRVSSFILKPLPKNCQAKISAWFVPK